MGVSIVTFANLGTKNNLKTADIEPVIIRFSKENELQQVISQLHAGFKISVTISAIPALVRYPLRIFEKVFGLPRRTYEMIFDYGAARRLLPSEFVILHGGALLPRTAARASARGAIVADIAVTAHLRTNAAIEQEELKRLGIESADKIYTQMYEDNKNLFSGEYVIVMSEFVKDSYVQAGFPQEKIFIASPDIALARFAPQQKKDDTFRVVYTAYTTVVKGLEYLLDAWDSLSLPNSELLIVGGFGSMPKELRDRYEERIQKYTTIRAVGSTSTPEQYYTNASVLVFPSLSEGFGRVTLEAMACGIPVITTENAAGIVEDGVTGFVVPIRDGAAIREKIQFLYDHPEKREAMGKAAREAVEKKKPFGEAVYEIYKDILERELKRKNVATTV